MQLKHWDDLRYLLALKRAGSLSVAAKLLGVNETTVSRRIAGLQKSAGSPLIHRLASGAVELTPLGSVVAEQTEYAEQHIERIEEALGADTQTCIGIVRLTSVPIVVNQLLAPNVGSLLTKHPELEIELVSESRDLSLTQRETDMAIRLGRPVAGGTQQKIRKLGELSSAACALSGYNTAQVAKLPWITYDDSLAHIPPARWIQNITEDSAQIVARLRVRDAETALQAVLAGVGKAVLPEVVVSNEKRLQHLEFSQLRDPPARELWLVTRANQGHVRRIEAVTSWIEEVMEVEPLR